MQISELKENQNYIYRFYNRGQKRWHEYPVIYWGKTTDGIYIFDMAKVDGHLRLPEEEVKNNIVPESEGTTSVSK